MIRPIFAFSSSLALAGASLVAQCPPPDQVVTPFNIPVAAGGWSIQHNGPPLVAGQVDYIIISLPSLNPVPFAALPWLFCNTVGNTPCLYVELNAVSWFAFGPSTGTQVSVGITWPNNPLLSGTLFVAQTGTAGCTGTPDLSVLITGRLQ